jgi:mannose-6-phosphate isomerase-like protein (cupin superfamily)
MTQPYDWPYHPNSDETFMTLEGVLVIDLETETIELSPGQLFTISKNVGHSTRPQGARSVNITSEHGQLETIRIDPR